MKINATEVKRAVHKILQKEGLKLRQKIQEDVEVADYSRVPWIMTEMPNELNL